MMLEGIKDLYKGMESTGSGSFLCFGHYTPRYLLKRKKVYTYTNT